MRAQPGIAPASPATPQTATDRKHQADIQANILQLIARLAGSVRTLEGQNQDLQQQVTALRDGLDARLESLRSEVLVAGANSAVNELDRPADTASHRAPAPRHPAAVRPDVPKPEHSPPRANAALKSTTPHYTIQAASPDFAILSGSGTALSVKPGDHLDGYGTVLEIAPRGGGNWVVRTDHGSVQ